MPNVIIFFSARTRKTTTHGKHEETERLGRATLQQNFTQKVWTISLETVSYHVNRKHVKSLRPSQQKSGERLFLPLVGVHPKANRAERESC